MNLYFCACYAVMAVVYAIIALSSLMYGFDVSHSICSIVMSACYAQLAISCAGGA